VVTPLPESSAVVVPVAPSSVTTSPPGSGASKLGVKLKVIVHGAEFAASVAGQVLFVIV